MLMKNIFDHSFQKRSGALVESLADVYNEAQVVASTHLDSIGCFEFFLQSWCITESHMASVKSVKYVDPGTGFDVLYVAVGWECIAIRSKSGTHR